MTGLLPFSHLKRTTEVLIAVQKGVRPRKPTDPEIRARGLDDGLWSVLTECWMANPFERPAIDKVFAQLQTPSKSIVAIVERYLREFRTSRIEPL